MKIGSSQSGQINMDKAVVLVGHKCIGISYHSCMSFVLIQTHNLPSLIYTSIKCIRNVT